jgi:hypothetical protein
LATSRFRIRNSIQWIDSKAPVSDHAAIRERANGKWLGVALDYNRDGPPQSNCRIANTRRHDLPCVNAVPNREGTRRAHRQPHDAGDDAKQHQHDQQLDERDTAIESHVGRTL